MSGKDSSLVKKDAWDNLSSFTNARIALGSVGNSIPLKEVLQFKLAHAHAKDAIYTELDIPFLEKEIQSLGFPIWTVKSKVQNREEYLKRPDFGRLLNTTSEELFRNSTNEFDIIFVLADGLSAEAVNTNAISLLKEVLPQLDSNYNVGFVLTTHARVALGDAIGTQLKAKFTAVLIGERPGLSSPESMGIYTTYAPTKGLTDERRNCISNIHKNGLTPKQGALLLNYLIQQSFAKQISGVALKINLKELLDKE
ncbi:ethanolamine ammonia-lyase subunit EutC [Muricauda sp. CAU 1633]|uniref:ethanolamine ammonia-lyase subunit EutC n=1 Tax=Allomuricauda sp. CAU 1633 TaxID=2816036 RepID=UPI001A8CE8BC|nr:ethanolamine ammonia-lyase subunit EutC [Muricauda sp. CAU 1633]MBO0321286.1 ethanolamine ammonia-lyase subunit EutC [Muricauda sp. CAU 1633]